MPAFDAYSDPTRPIHGGSRTKPRPFERPSIDLDRVSRAWRNVPVADLEAEDIVAEFGKLKAVGMLPDDTTEIINILGERRVFMDSYELFAFTRKRDA